MGTAPDDLVDFGKTFRVSGRTVTLTPDPGPRVSLRWGTLALADPWWPEALPDTQVIAIGAGVQPTLLSTVAVTREGRATPVPTSCAATIGPVEQVASWQPLVQHDAHVHLDSDSALGAFYDITDADVLRPLFEDAQHMQGVYNRVLDERVVTMEVDGRAAAVVFLCPDGSGLYPAYAGFDKDMQAAAVLVDLRLLDDAT